MPGRSVRRRPGHPVADALGDAVESGHAGVAATQFGQHPGVGFDRGHPQVELQQVPGEFSGARGEVDRPAALAQGVVRTAGEPVHPPPVGGEERLVGREPAAPADVDGRVDPRGQAYYWIEEGQNDWEPHDRSDYQAVKDGYISVTPLQPDLTDYNALALLDELSVWKEAGVE